MDKQDFIDKGWDIVSESINHLICCTRGNIKADTYYGARIWYDTETSELEVLVLGEDGVPDKRFHGVCYDVSTFDLIMTTIDGLSLLKLQKLKHLGDTTSFEERNSVSNIQNARYPEAYLPIKS
jgi:hypothetical protein